MSWLSDTGMLIGKEFKVEWKQKYALSGLFLYAFVMVFVVSLMLAGEAEPQTWNVIFWILLLFVSVNAVAKSFMTETRGQFLYLYTLAGPRAVFAAKLIYNFFILSAAGLVTSFLYNFFSPQPIADLPFFIAGILLGSLGFSANLTLVSSITAAASNKTTLFAVLSFPLTVPLILTSIKITESAMEGLPRNESLDELAFVSGFIIIISSVSFILFPSLWRE